MRGFGLSEEAQWADTMFADRVIAERAGYLFDRALRRARWHRFWMWLFGKRTAVECLVGQGGLVGRPEGHIRLEAVPIAKIRGSEGRCTGFDDEFNPLHSYHKVRWVDVCKMLISGAALPPIELIQVGEMYYVRDGHHRVSAARALGQEQIEAEVTVWL